MYGVHAIPGLYVFATVLYASFALKLSIVDFRTGLLPDRLTLPLLWLGLLFQCIAAPDAVADAVYGAVGGYLFLWFVLEGFKLITGKPGLGYGDVKLLAAIGAWNGWQSLPGVVVVASLLGLLFAAVSLLATRKVKKTIAFGPWLVTAGWGEFIWQVAG